MSIPRRLRQLAAAAGAVALSTTVIAAPATAQPTWQILVQDVSFTEEFAPGDLVSYQPTIHNAGTAATTHLAIRLFDARYALHEQRFGNCQYSPDEGSPTGSALCQFEFALAPGETAQVSPDTAIGLRVQPDVPHRQFINASFTVDAWDGLIGDDPGEFGDGPQLQLAKIAQDGEFDGQETFGNVLFHAGPNPADFEAVGAAINGSVGDTVTIEPGITNHGPAALAGQQPGEGWVPHPLVTINLPTGVTVTGFPPGAGDLEFVGSCYPLIDGEPDFDRRNQPDGLDYQCFVSELGLAAGQSWLFPLELEITSAIEAAGEVTVTSEPNDPDPSNNLAAITLHGDDAGGAGGGLPVTGSATALMAGGGLLALLVGAGLFLLARRRRIRFTDEPADS